MTGHVNGNLVNATSTDGLTTNNADSATGESVGPSVTSAAPPAGAGFFSAPSCTGASLGITTCTASVNFADSEGIGCGNATTACSPTLRKIVAATVNRTGDVLDIPKVDPAYLGVPMSEDSEQDLLQILGQLNYFTYYPKGLGYKVEWNQPSPSISNTFQTGNISFKGNLFLVRNGTIPLVFPLAPPLVFPTPIATGDASFVSVTPAEQLADGSFALVNFERFVTARANFLFDQGDATFGSFRVQFVTPAHIIEACYGTKTSTQNGCSEAAPAAGSTEDLIPSGNDKRWRVDDGNWTSHANVINALSGSDTRVVRARLIVDGGVLVPDQTAGAQVVKLSNWTLEFTKSDATTATLSFSPPPATDPVQLVGNIPQGGILISSPTGQGFRIDPSQVNINNTQFQSGVSAEALLAFFGSGPLQARWTSEEFGLRDAPVDFCVQFPGTNVCP